MIRQIGETPGAARSKRSCLTVPGSDTRMLHKARSLPADQVVLDLEDAVAFDSKDAARQLVVAALRESDWQSPARFVRVNDVTTPWTLADLTTLVEGAGSSLHGVVVPKVAAAAQVHFVDLLLTQLERASGMPVGSVAVELQIETAGGLRDISSLLAASGRVEAITFGPGDLATDLGLPATVVGAPQDGYPGDHWHHVRSTIVIEARAAGVQALDGPYAAVRDLDGFRELAVRSRSLGFDGTWVLHPGQVAIANEVYGVDRAEFERASDLVDAYAAEQQGRGRGAAMFGMEMMDEATRRQAALCLEKGWAQGLTARAVPDSVPFHKRQEWREENL